MGTRPTLAWPLDAGTVPAPVGHFADLCVDEARGHYQTTFRTAGAENRLRVPSNGVSGTCVLCGGSTSLLYDDCTDFEYFMTAPGDLYRCGTCGLVAMEPIPTRAELPGLYPAEYENFSGPRNPVARFLLAPLPASPGRHLPQAPAARRPHPRDRLRHRRRPRRARRRLPGGARHRAERGGVRRSPAARGLDVFCGTLEEYETDQQYDVVFMSHVIEHVLDPVETVAHHRAPARAGWRAVPRDPQRRLARRAGVEAALGPHPLPPPPVPVRPQRPSPACSPSAELTTEGVRWEPNSCGWALSVQSWLRRRGHRPFESAAIAVLPRAADAVPPAQPPRRRVRRHRVHVGDRPQGRA